MSKESCPVAELDTIRTLYEMYRSKHLNGDNFAQMVGIVLDNPGIWLPRPPSPEEYTQRKQSEQMMLDRNYGMDKNPNPNEIPV